MTKAEAINLYAGIAPFKNGEMSRETLYKLIMSRIKMKEVNTEFEEVKNEFMEQTKPKGIKEGDSTEEWNNAYQPLILKWLNEEVDIPPVFTIDEALDYIEENKVHGVLQDEIISKMAIQA